MNRSSARRWLTLWWSSLLIVVLVAAACDEQGPESQPARGGADRKGFVGSASCRKCHERFYELWAPSHHGTAMQPFTSEFAAKFLTPQDETIAIGIARYRAVVGEGRVEEDGPEGRTSHPIAHVMGGKNVFFFLTPRERGRLQVLPVAYDVREKRWYDTTASMVRHAVGHTDDPVHWTDPLLTFNTSCWNCHVSQLSLNYDSKTDSYQSEWAEPGINCETCHGPAGEHVRVCEEAVDGEVPEDLAITSVKSFSVEQRNDTCAPCHAKSISLTRDFQPGDAYFDHFDLVTLEDADFHPDGRDLGENYTFTLWRMSPCAQSGKLDCIHCHTSSGRYRFHGENANGACLPCHAEHVENATEHTHHKVDGPASRCVACHMPMTEFALMRRSDHSMRPPAPAATLRFGSPNACNLCHDDEDANWANEHVRAWRSRDYQAPLLEAGELVAAARRHDWTRLDDMLAYLLRKDRDEVVATSLLRLLQACSDPRKFPPLSKALADPSPLVRSAAAAGMGPLPTVDLLDGLLGACSDPVRLVRVRAAGTLAGVPARFIPSGAQDALEKATGELLRALSARPDSWTTHYNLGNFFDQRGELKRALVCYERASVLRPDVVPPLVNAAMAHARMGGLKEAEKLLRRALAADPDNAEAHYNMGLLLAERGRKKDAEKHLRAALKADPNLVRAALNLGVLVGERDAEEAITWCRKAWALEPGNGKAATTLAYYLIQAKQPAKAVDVLSEALTKGARTADVYAMLGRLYQTSGDVAGAKAVYERAATDERLSPRERAAFGRMK